MILSYLICYIAYGQAPRKIKLFYKNTHSNYIVYVVIDISIYQYVFLIFYIQM